MGRTAARRGTWRYCAGALAAATLIAVTVGRVAPEGARAAEPSAKPADTKPDPFVVPDGPPEQLLKYIERLGQLEPTSRDAEGLAQFGKKVAGSILQAADKVLAAKPTEAQAAEAVEWKLEALRLAERTGDAEADAKLKAMPAELEKLGWKRLARGAQAMVLGMELSRATGDDKAFPELLKRIEAYVSEGDIGRREVSLAMDAVMAAERVGPEVAAQGYQGFAKLFIANPNKEIASLGAKMQGAARRLTLVGKPMDLAGQTLDGKPLDWAKYRGKVVLVAFWATWCGPCRTELKNIREQFAAFRDKGFDVVAVSVDREREALAGYVKDSPVPWTVLADQALHSDKADKSMGTMYGVISIPQLILVGKDGNVVATNVHGPRLRELLEGILGKPSAPEKPAAKEG